MLLFLFVGCWFECITRIFYTCRCSISCTSECLEWKIHISALLGSKKPFWLKLGKPLILVTFWESHLRNDLRIRCHSEKFNIGFFSQTFFLKKSKSDFWSVTFAGEFEQLMVYLHIIILCTLTFISGNTSKRKLIQSNPTQGRMLDVIWRCQDSCQWSSQEFSPLSEASLFVFCSKFATFVKHLIQGGIYKIFQQGLKYLHHA